MTLKVNFFGCAVLLVFWALIWQTNSEDISYAACGAEVQTGTFTLNATSGVITDGDGDYLTDVDCRFIIQPAGSTKGIILQFFPDTFYTESSYDEVYIYDGIVEDSDFLLGTLSGYFDDVQTFYSTSPSMLIIFQSDYSTSYDGFVANYTLNPYDPYNCEHLSNCSGNGNCTQLSNCECNDGYSGDDCSQDVDECSISNPCYFGGTCVNTYGSYTCECSITQHGPNCEFEYDFEDQLLEKQIISTSSIWVCPPGIYEAYVSLWGCGGSAAISILKSCQSPCSSNSEAYCLGGKGGGGGGTKKRVPLTPGKEYEIYVPIRSNDLSTSFSDYNTSAVLAYATNGGNGFAPLNPYCSASKCTCYIPSYGSPGNGEDPSDPNVIESIQGCRAYFTDTTCCPGVTMDGISTGAGFCASPEPGLNPFNVPLGQPGLVVITPRSRKYPINFSLCNIAHVPSDQTKIFDNVSLQVLLVDVLDNKYFASNFASSYAGNITVYYRNLDTNFTFTTTVVPHQGDTFNFLASYYYNQVGTYNVWAELEGHIIGSVLNIIVRNQLLIIPLALSLNFAMGGNYTSTLNVANIGSQEATWTAQFLSPVPWVHLREGDFLNKTTGTSTVEIVSLDFIMNIATIQDLEPKNAVLQFIRDGQVPILVNIDLYPSPGSTDPSLSSWRMNSTIFEVKTPANFEITLVDAFGFVRTENSDIFKLIISTDGTGQNQTSLNEGIDFRWSCLKKEEGGYVCSLTLFEMIGHFIATLYTTDYVNDYQIGSSISFQSSAVSCTYPEVSNFQGTSCVCDVGYWRNNDGLCNPCEQKTFKSTIGDFPCASCPKNTYSNGVSCLCVETAFELSGACYCKAGYDPATECSKTCRSGTFSVDGSLRCEECQSDAFSCKDGLLEVLDGYWWPQTEFSTSTSSQFLQCPRASVCKAANFEYLNTSSPPEPSCIEGHDPNYPLCSVCLSGYASSGGDSICHKCWPAAANWVALVCIVLFILFIAIIVVSRSGIMRSSSSVLLRISINYIQVTYLFSKFKTNGGEIFYNIFSLPTSVGNGFSVDFFPVQCALGWSYYARWGFYMSLPFLILLFSYLIVFVDQKLFQRFDLTKRSYSDLFKASVVALLFLIYSQLGIQIFSVFHCYPHEIKGQHPLMASMDLNCYTTSHIVAMCFGGIFLIVYLIGIPAMGVYVIRRYRNELTKNHVAQSYGFLYEGYALKGVRPYWEVVVLGRKIGLMIILVFINSGNAQNFYASLLLIVALLLQLFIGPYKNEKLNAAESLSLLVSFMTQYLSLLLWDNNSNHTAVIVIIIFINLLFLLFLIVNIIQAIYIERIKEKGLTLKDLPRKARRFIQRTSFIPEPEEFFSSNSSTAVLNSKQKGSMNDLCMESQEPPKEDLKKEDLKEETSKEDLKKEETEIY